MRKFISIIGIIGVLMIIIFSIIDHELFINDRPFYACIGISFLLFVPMLVRELLSVRNKNKELK